MGVPAAWPNAWPGAGIAGWLPPKLKLPVDPTHHALVPPASARTRDWGQRGPAFLAHGERANGADDYNSKKADRGALSASRAPRWAGGAHPQESRRPWAGSLGARSPHQT